MNNYDTSRTIRGIEGAQARESMEECGRSDVCDSGVVRHVGRRERNAFRDIFLTQIKGQT